MDPFAVYEPVNLMFEEENPVNYQPGGYHPVKTGDKLGTNRYEIFSKLGYGGFSTVWLARDDLIGRWVSIKIVTANKSTHSQELSTLHILKQKADRDTRSKHFTRLLDNFIHEGPNGSHLCLVFELLGPTVNIIARDYIVDGERLGPRTLLRICEQLLQGIAFLHEAGIAHGDLSVRNLAFTSSRLSKSSSAEIFAIVGSPVSEPLVRLDGAALSTGVPGYLVKSATWDDWTDEDDEDIRIIDLGEAFVIGSAPQRLPQPGDLQAPETIFLDKIDYEVDLWRIGLIIYYLLFGASPFQWTGSVDVLVAQMINFSEPLPQEWQPQWKRMRLDAGRDLNLTHGLNSMTEIKLDKKFGEKVQEPSLQILLPIIKGLTKFLPSHRIPAAEALKLLQTNPYKPDEDFETNDEEK